MTARGVLKSLLFVCVLQSAVFGEFAIAQSQPMRNRRAEPDSSNLSPAYPRILRSSAIVGLARVRIVVDTNGRSARATRTLFAADHPLFALAVDKALDQWTFIPAVKRGRFVPDTLEIEVQFQATGERARSLFESVLIGRKSPAAGRWQYVIGPSQRDLNAPMPDSVSQTAIAIAVLDTLFAETARKDSLYPDRIACVTLELNGKPTEPTLANLIQLSRRGVVPVSQRRCPRSFGSPFRTVATAGIASPEPDPAGEDPFEFRVKEMRAWSTSEISVSVRMWHATGGTEYACVATPDARGKSGWRARCLVVAHISS